MSPVSRVFTTLIGFLASFALVVAASADPFASVVISLPSDADGDIDSPGVVLVESLNQDSDTPKKGKKGKKGKGKKGRKGKRGKIGPYMETEYFVEGAAEVYKYGVPPVVNELILRTDLPTDYKTRFIVRRPVAMKSFRGTVVVEWWNSTAGFDTAPAWDASAEHFARRGWIYVGISNSNQVFNYLTVNSCAILPPFTPPACGARYTSLSLPENGIAYEMVSQLVNLLRGDDPQNPLLGYNIKHVLHVGQSQQAGSLVTYSKEFHEPSLSDGYFIQAGSGTSRILSTGSPQFLVFDPRTNPPTDLEVPVIRAQTETEVETFGVTFNRQADTATFRYYEIAGAAHLTVHKDVPIIPAGIFGPDPVFLEDLCLNPMNTLVDGPVFGKYVYNAMWDNLDKQAKNISKQMPSADPIEGSPPFGLPLLRDGDGNVLGGIRLPDMNVPIGSYYASTNTAKAACTFPPFPPDCNPIGPLGNLVCRLAGSTEPFSQATLVSRYPTNKVFRDLVRQDARRLRRAGFLTREDEKEINARARFSGIPN